MRNYPVDSPEAMGRLVALALMVDGAIDPSELKLLNRKDTIRRLGLSHASFDQLVHDLCDDMLRHARRTPSRQLELDSQRIHLLLAEIQHPVLQKGVLRIMLDIAHADQQLSAGEAVLLSEAMKFWGIDLSDISDCAIPCPSLPPERLERGHV